MARPSPAGSAGCPSQVEGGEGQPGDDARAHLPLEANAHPLTRAQNTKTRIHDVRRERQLNAVIEHHAAAAGDGVLGGDCCLHSPHASAASRSEPAGLGGPTATEQTGCLRRRGSTDAESERRAQIGPGVDVTPQGHQVLTEDDGPGGDVATA